jgi:GT2 family glycosyltransferase
MTIDLSIIIVSYNTKKILKDCINAVIETTMNKEYEIIVVDNASTDGSVEMIETDFADITIIKNTENLGFAKANNQAMRTAKGDFFLMLNSDTIVKEGAIEALVNFMEKQEGSAAVGPKVLNVDGTIQSKGSYFPSLSESLILFLRIHKFFTKKIKSCLFPKIFGDENTINKVDWVSGCCILIRRDIAYEIGLLDEAFFFYGEEIEWCFRAKQAGYSVYYFPRAEIIHYGGASKIDSSLQRLNDTRRALYKKCFGKSRGILITVMKILTFIVSLIKAFIVGTAAEEKHALITTIRFHYILLKKVISRNA